MKLPLLIVLLPLFGCASTPFVELSLGTQLNGSTDYWLQTERSWQCKRNLQFNGTFGLEFDDDKWYIPSSVGLHHQSWLLCGGPFNSRPEVDTNDIRVTKKFWGKR